MRRPKNHLYTRHQEFARKADVNQESLFTRISALIAATALTVAIAPNAKILYRSLPFNECSIGDDTSVKEYEKKISTLFDSDFTKDTTNPPATAYEGKPEIKMVGLTPSDIANSAQGIAGRLSEILSRTSSKFIEASGVDTIRIQDIEKDFDGLNSIGLFTLSLPHSIVIDYPNLDYVVNAPEDESDYEQDQATLSGIIIHEMGHAAVAEFCYTSDPPEEFVDSSAYFESYADIHNDDEPYYKKGFVSEYAATDPAEDIAETIKAIMGTALYDPAVNILQLSLNDDNLILREKVAVILTMLDRLEPGLGADALAKMKNSRNELLKDDMLYHLDGPSG